MLPLVVYDCYSVKYGMAGNAVNRILNTQSTGGRINSQENMYLSLSQSGIIILVFCSVAAKATVGLVVRNGSLPPGL